jgi:hypothetical protein
LKTTEQPLSKLSLSALSLTLDPPPPPSNPKLASQNVALSSGGVMSGAAFHTTFSVLVHLLFC